jgi:four helix bundle protein
MNKAELAGRTKAFALAVIRLVESLQRNRTCEVIGRQLLRSATSIGANYRSALRARSPADFLSKMGIVEEEADETLYWLELLEESGQAGSSQCRPLLDEGSQILSIIVASIRTLKSRKRTDHPG